MSTTGSGKGSVLATLAALALMTGACGGGGSNSTSGGISLQLAANSLVAPQDGTAASVGATVTRTAGNANSITLSVRSLPAGVTAQVGSPGTGNTGAVAFTATPAAAAGTYLVGISASDGTTSASANLSLVVAIVATVRPTVNTGAGAGGRLQNFMSTSFQPAAYCQKFLAFKLLTS